MSTDTELFYTAAELALLPCAWCHARDTDKAGSVSGWPVCADNDACDAREVAYSLQSVVALVYTCDVCGRAYEGSEDGAGCYEYHDENWPDACCAFYGTEDCGCEGEPWYSADICSDACEKRFETTLRQRKAQRERRTRERSASVV